jgi:RNA recognition motif-containing protein
LGAIIRFSKFKPGEFEKAVMFKIYIGNLENGVTLDQLKELTASFTDIEDLVLVMDPETGESRCFAIAMFRDAARGQLLIETLSGNILNGRPMIVNEVVKKAKGAAKKPFRRPQRGNGSGGGDRGRSSENRPVSRQMDFPSSGRPADGGGMPNLGSMGSMSGPPRIPTRPPSGRPSSRPVSRGISRGNFGNSQSGGSASGGSPGGSSGFARPNAAGNNPAGNGGPFRPAPPATSPPGSAPQSAPAITPKPIPQPPAGNVSPTRSATPKPPVVRRLDTPPDQGNPSGA